MRSQLKSMDENQVWDLVDPPPGVTAIGCKWVFMKKPMWMEMFRSTKLGLSLKVMDKFKEFTMMSGGVKPGGSRVGGPELCV